MEFRACVRETTFLFLTLFLLISVQPTICETCKNQEDSMCGIIQCENVPLTCTNVTTEMLTQLEYCNTRSSYYLEISDSKMLAVDTNLFPVKCDFRLRISKLILENNSIQTIDVDTFAGFSSVHTLNIGDNEIANIAFLKHLNQLRVLNVSFNNLKVIKKETFEGFANLMELYLNNNFIREVEDSAFQSMQSLYRFHLDSNKLQTIPKNMMIGLKNLQYLSLQENQINSIVPEAFTGLTSLISIDLSGNFIDALEENVFVGLHEIGILNLTKLNVRKIQPGAFTSMNSLLTLDLATNNLETLQEKTFSGLANLKYLFLQNNPINSISPGAFFDLTALISIDLSGSNLSTLHNNTFQRLRNVCSLYLSNTKIRKIETNGFMGLESIYLIQSNFRNNLQLDRGKTWYDFRKFSLQSVEPDALGKLNYYSDGGNFLYLNDNNLTILLQNTFRNVSHLNLLKLDNNRIEKIQPYTFDTMTFNQKLTSYNYNGVNYCNSLDLYHNKLTVLHKNTFGKMKNVMKLRLDNNNINEIHPEAFSGVSFRSKTTDNNILYLNQNKLTRLLNNTFKNTENLVVLRLDHNEIATIELEVFTDLHELKTLDLCNNKISILNPELFDGLTNLQNLLLTYNQIKELPMGSLKHFPRLQNLHLANNSLSRFRTGSFSNLGELIFLNLSHNKFFALNETVFYPLKNLNLLDLDDNNFSYINYTSLLVHLPRLKFIGVNNNRWSCQMLTHMLKTFRSMSIDYLFNATLHYTEENVDGILCTEYEVENNVTQISKIQKSKLLNQTNENESLKTISHYLEEILEFKTKSNFVKTVDSGKYVTLEQFQKLIGDLSKISNDNSHPDVYVIAILIFVCCLVMCTLLGFSVYKKHCQKINGKIPLNKLRSEIELMNASSLNDF